MTEYKTYRHNPPHLFIANAKYFITASTYRRKKYLRSSSAKERLIRSLNKEFSKHNWTIEDWVILDNHYHLMVNAPENSNTLPDIMRESHRFTALWIKKSMESTNHTSTSLSTSVDDALTSVYAKAMPGRRSMQSIKRKIFYNYFDTCITYEKSYFARVNYIWYNPVKHGYVDSPEKWKFGSYYYRYQEETDAMKRQMEKYSFDNLKDKR